MHSGGNYRRSGSRGMKQLGPKPKLIRSGALQGSKSEQPLAGRTRNENRHEPLQLVRGTDATSLTGQRTTDQVEFPTRTAGAAMPRVPVQPDRPDFRSAPVAASSRTSSDGAVLFSERDWRDLPG